MKMKTVFQDFRLVLNHVANFLKTRFSPESRLLQLNLVGVDSNGTNLKAANFGVDTVDEIFAKLIQKKRVLSKKLQILTKRKP